MKNLFTQKTLIKQLFSSILLVAAAFTLASCVQTKVETTKDNLHFHDGEFKIGQFTDLHLDASDMKEFNRTMDCIKTVVEMENPDIAIITGDVITGEPAISGWEKFTEAMDKMNIPFIVTMGNHDAEYDSKDHIYDILLTAKNYVGAKGPDYLTGMGNYILPIYGSVDQSIPSESSDLSESTETSNNKSNSSEESTKIKALLYNIDSNDYPTNKFFGHYDWIHFDQIDWYRKMSAKFTESNGGTPIPSLAFIHIPLLEYVGLIDDPKTIGRENEHCISSADLNSGLFTSILEMGDIIGVFAGHDHDNDFVGIKKDIALGFGRVSGYQAYGDFVRGGRMIVLKEDERKFDTYIVTPEGKEETFYYPSAINSKDEKTMTYLDALDVNPTKNGVAFEYYEGRKGLCKKLEQIKKCTLVEKGNLNNFDISNAKVEDFFAYKFSSYIKIPSDGIYRFYTYSDDGSAVYIDGVKVVDNDGGHSARRREGQIALRAGFHKIEVDYFEDYMGQELEVGMLSKEILECTIPDSLLFTF